MILMKSNNIILKQIKVFVINDDNWNNEIFIHPQGLNRGEGNTIRKDKLISSEYL